MNYTLSKDVPDDVVCMCNARGSVVVTLPKYDVELYPCSEDHAIWMVANYCGQSWQEFCDAFKPATTSSKNT